MTNKNLQNTQLIKLEKPLYPQLVTDLATQNQFLKVVSYSLLALTAVLTVILIYCFRKAPEVIALDPSGTIASVSQELHTQHVEAAARKYLEYRYNWNPQNIQAELLKAESFIDSTLVTSFKKSMLDTQKFVKDKNVTQRVYPQKINVSLKDKTVTIIADRFTEFDALKAATTLRTTLTFDLDSPTATNPWGIYFVKESESADSK